MRFFFTGTRGLARTAVPIILLGTALALPVAAAHAHNHWDNGESSPDGSRPNAVDRRTPIICAPIRSGATRLATMW